jgi:hypothetical protein
MGLFHMEYIWNGLLLENDQAITSSTYSKTIPNVFQSFSTDFCDLFSNLFRIWQNLTWHYTITNNSDSGYIQPQYKILSKQTLLLL